MTALTFRTPRGFAVSTIAAASLLALAPMTSKAQNHIGNGQAVQINADLVSAVDISVGSAQAQLPSPAGGTDSVGPSAYAQTVTLVNATVVGNIVTVPATTLTANANAVYGDTRGGATSTVGNGSVFSDAGIATVGANTPSTNLTLGISTPLSLGANLSSFLTLKAIRTETTATGNSGRTSTTIIEGLIVRDALGNFVTVNGSGADLSGSGTTVLNGNSNLTFSESSDTVQFTVGGGTLGLGALATVRLHDKLNNGDGSRTTNGISVGVGTGFLGGSVASTNVILASSTAGVSGAASVTAPEPGTVGFLMTPLVTGLAVQVRRRRKIGIMQQN